MIRPDDHTLRTTVEKWIHYAEEGQKQSRRDKVEGILDSKRKVMREKCIKLFEKFKEDLHELIERDNIENTTQSQNERDLDFKALLSYHDLFR